MRGIVSLILALGGCGVAGWAIADIASRPPGSFHDQGGMAIAFFYFPVALFGWLLLGLPGVVLGIVAARRGAGRAAAWTGRAAIVVGLVGFVLAFVVLLGPFSG